jgi:hypothetical protein
MRARNAAFPGPPWTERRGVDCLPCGVLVEATAEVVGAAYVTGVRVGEWSGGDRRSVRQVRRTSSSGIVWRELAGDDAGCAPAPSSPPSRCVRAERRPNHATTGDNPRARAARPAGRPSLRSGWPANRSRVSGGSAARLSAKVGSPGATLFRSTRKKRAISNGENQPDCHEPSPSRRRRGRCQNRRVPDQRRLKRPRTMPRRKIGPAAAAHDSGRDEYSSRIDRMS